MNNTIFVALMCLLFAGFPDEGCAGPLPLLLHQSSGGLTRPSAEYEKGAIAYEWITTVESHHETPRNPRWQIVLAMKEMKKEIEALKARVAELEGKGK